MDRKFDILLKQMRFEKPRKNLETKPKFQISLKLQ